MSSLTRSSSFAAAAAVALKLVEKRLSGRYRDGVSDIGCGGSSSLSLGTDWANKRVALLPACLGAEDDWVVVVNVLRDVGNASAESNADRVDANLTEPRRCWPFERWVGRGTIRKIQIGIMSYCCEGVMGELVGIYEAVSSSLRGNWIFNYDKRIKENLVDLNGK